MIIEQALWIALVLYLLLGCFVPRDPTQCNFIGALIGGAASLIGASKQRKEQRRINEANRPVNQVREWEEAGINPLFGISSGGYVPHQTASIGDAYAEAGARFGQAFDQHRAEKLAQTELKKENTQLREKLDKLADPSEPSYMSQYGGVLPLPRQGEIHAQGGNSRSGAFRTTGVVRDSGNGLTDDDIPSILVPFRAENGEIVMLPNPDLPDADQYVPALAGAGAASVQERGGFGPNLPAIGDFFGEMFSPSTGTQRKRSGEKAKPRPPKPDTKTKEYRDFMKSAYPTAFD
jgi:gas vesicle protein